MHRIELSDRELDELHAMLQHEVDSVRVEMRRTDDPAFKETVRDRYEMLEHMLEVVTSEKAQAAPGS